MQSLDGMIMMSQEEKFEIEKKLNLIELENRKQLEKIKMLENALLNIAKHNVDNMCVRIPTESLYSIIKEYEDGLVNENKFEDMYEESFKVGWRNYYCEFGFCAEVENNFLEGMKEMLDEISNTFATPEYVGM